MIKAAIEKPVHIIAMIVMVLCWIFGTGLFAWGSLSMLPPIDLAVLRTVGVLVPGSDFAGLLKDGGVALVLYGFVAMQTDWGKLELSLALASTLTALLVAGYAVAYFIGNHGEVWPWYDVTLAAATVLFALTAGLNQRNVFRS